MKLIITPVAAEVPITTVILIMGCAQSL